MSDIHPSRIGEVWFGIHRVGGIVAIVFKYVTCVIQCTVKNYEEAS